MPSLFVVLSPPATRLRRVWALAATAFAAAAAAQPAPRSATLDPVAVTASRTAQPIADLLADLTVIGADEILRSGAQSLPQLLQRQPGVEVTINGGAGSTSGAFLRGANRGQTLVLIDGLRVGSSSVGATSLEAIPLDQIERIEILRGPASSLYGADAIGGVIQVITKRAAGTTFAGSASAGYGTWDTKSASAGLRGALGPLAFSLQGGGTRSAGFNAIVDPGNFSYDGDRDGYASENAGLNATLPWAAGQEVAVQYFRNRLNNRYDGGPGFDDRTVTTLEAWSVASRNRVAAWWKSTATVGEGSDDSVSQTAYGDYPYQTTQRQYTWQNDFTLPAGTLSLIAERREERLATTDAFAVTQRNTNSATGVWQMTHDALALQANLRHDRSSQYGGETTGGIAAGYRLAPAWRVTAGYSTGFKAPSFNDLYYPGFSNPALQPETARNAEAGIYWTAAAGGVRWEARAIGYRNRVDDLIVFQCDADYNCLPRNVDRATLSGVTLGVDAAWRDTRVKGSLDLQEPEDDATGALLPRRARRHGVLTVLQQAGPVQVGAEFVASSLRYDDLANTRKMGGYGIVNVTLDWPFASGWVLSVRGNNVLDKDYQLAADYATGGANVFATIRWQP
ncbi:MAG: TonB-dependent receptor [Betaproteobacteria bacterium]|nr:TonB-dependent receptor [Betaproteobacteria bacterium]